MAVRLLLYTALNWFLKSQLRAACDPFSGVILRGQEVQFQDNLKLLTAN